MGTLQLGLAVLGGLTLAAVVAHGAWTARKSGVRTAAGPLDASGAGPREPRFDDLPDAPAVEAAPVETVATRAGSRRAVPQIDALIDAIATLSLEAPISGEQALAHVPVTRRAGGKPLAIEGLNTVTGGWEAPQPQQTYSEFQAGVLLANRTGALNEIEYSEFVQKVQAFADGINAMVDFPNMLDVVARARELDHFAGEHDAQLALRLRARGASWSLGYVQQHATRHGFVPGAIPGRLVLPAGEEGAPPMLTLQFDAQAAFAEEPAQAALRELSLAFDVPQTAPEHEPFKAWCAAAEALSLALDADLLDDAGQPLHPQAFAAIGAELNRLYEALQARDLAAGSPAARRLFS